MASLSRDELVTALRAHRNNDVYVIAETYPNGDDDSMGEPFYARLAVSGVRYDPVDGLPADRRDGGLPLMARSITLDRPLTYEIETCCACGVEFGMTADFIAARRRDGGTFHCPNGHGQVYTGSEMDLLRKRVKELEAQKTHLADQRDAARADVNRLAAEAAELELTAKRKARRASAGVCTAGCNRTFQQLARHMRSKHPEQQVEENQR